MRPDPTEGKALYMADVFDPYRIAYPEIRPAPLAQTAGGGGAGALPPALDLPDFMDHVRWLLDKITGDWRELLIPRGRRVIVRDAFDDLETRDVFSNARTELGNAANKPALVTAGLAGKQLDMKLSKFRELWSRFMSGGQGWLGRVLQFINKLLKSIVSAIPGVEAIAELKEQCEEEIADTA
jgi:hypothetical protein